MRNLRKIYIPFVLSMSLLINIVFVCALLYKVPIPIKEEYEILGPHRDFYPYALRGVMIEDCDTITPGIYLQSVGAPIDQIYFSSLYIFNPESNFSEDFPISESSIFDVRPCIKYSIPDGYKHLYSVKNPLLYSDPIVL